jgi:hypothetical protein
MNKIKKLNLTKKAASADRYYIMGIMPNAAGDDTDYYGHEETPPPRLINLSYNAYDITKYINFSDNFDEAGQMIAKTHQIYNNATSVGKVSIKDGNYPPPYTIAKARAFAYDQNLLCGDFIVTEMEFLIEPMDKYTMHITLQRGNGSATVNINNRMEVKPILGTPYEVILIGIENWVAPDLTLKFTAVGLDLSQEIGIVPVRYVAGDYNLDITNTLLFKKGVIELH